MECGAKFFRRFCEAIRNKDYLLPTNMLPPHGDKGAFR